MLVRRTDAIDGLIFAILLLAGAMLLAILLRYPSDARHHNMASIGLGLIAVSAILSLLLGSKRPLAGQGKPLGVRIGVLTGLMWVIEISFNNFVDPSISTGRARFYVDNGFWAAIALAILISSLATAFKARNITDALRVGLWSGYISGVISCLMALSLVLFGMRFLLRDPINISEYATRASGAPPAGMASYFAYETMAGALGHLFVLGVIMGLLLGTLGGIIGRFLAQLRRPHPPASH